MPGTAFEARGFTSQPRVNASVPIAQPHTLAVDEHQLRRSHRCWPLQSEAKQPSRIESGALLVLVQRESGRGDRAG
jgi:hypothetical protein